MINHPIEPADIRIPRRLWLAPGLSLREKALLAEISAADPVLGYRADNRQIIAFLGVRERHVRSCIAALRDKKFVTVRVNSAPERVIRPTGKLARLIKSGPKPVASRTQRKPD